MKEKINIAEILKDKQEGIRLYSPIFGDCAFSFVQEETDDICVKKHNGVIEYFNSEGLYFSLGEVMLFPSKEMRDWNKFFKKGDVLVCYEGKKPYYTIFDCFESNTYKDFKGKFAYDSYEDKWYHNECNLSTNTFHKLSIANSEIYKTKIEERFGGKLNLETLEIENAQTEFKDGDIVFVGSYMLGINTSSMIAIFRKDKEIDKYKFSPALCESNEHDTYLREAPVVLSPSEIMIFRPANESEKKKLFEALAKENKVWNAEKKQVVDLKIKWMALKPFDNVITRVDVNSIWTANIFSHVDQHGKYVTIGCISGYTYCLPYNEETAHLIGTTDEWKGGEG